MDTKIVKAALTTLSFKYPHLAVRRVKGVPLTGRSWKGFPVYSCRTTGTDMYSTDLWAGVGVSLTSGWLPVAVCIALDVGMDELEAGKYLDPVPSTATSTSLPKLEVLLTGR